MTLAALAGDPSVTVRASLAVNPALPRALRELLAQDADARVRAIIDRRADHASCPAAPVNGTPASHEAARPADAIRGQPELPAETLAELVGQVAEAAPETRRRVAELICGLPDGPRDLVLELAQDPSPLVAGPVVLFSPLLTDEDLLALIGRAPPAATTAAIARRAGIGPALADAIVECADSGAIKALLSNQTAQIREATLEALALQSEDNPEWQELLVERPVLPHRAGRALAEMVSGKLLRALRDRADLDPRLAQDLQAAQVGELDWSNPPAQAEPPLDASPASALCRAAALMAAGDLDGGTIIAALRRSETMLAMALLAVKANVALPVVERARTIRSARAIISLCWKARLGMQTAILVQAGLARLPPAAILRSARNGAWPLSEEAMEAELAALAAANDGLRAWIPRRLDPDSVARDLVSLAAEPASVTA